MQKVLSYDYKKSFYFGQIRGMSRGLPTSVRLPTGETKSILWGMAEKTKQRETLMVGFDMKRNSAVDVYVVCDAVVEEQPYTALLTAVFADGGRRERRVEGVMQNNYMDRIRAQYSDLYRIKDEVVVRTTPSSSSAVVTTGGHRHVHRELEEAHRRNVEEEGERMLSDQEEGEEEAKHYLLAVHSSGSGHLVPGGLFMAALVTLLVWP